MTTTNGSDQWIDAVERADDGDAAAGATFQSVDELASRTMFLRQNAQLAIANQYNVKLATSADRYTAVCHGIAAGPFDRSLFVACGPASNGGAAIAMSVNGTSWYDYAYATLNLGFPTPTRLRGVTHGGSGSLGDRKFLFCGHFTDGGSQRPCVFSISDAADENASPLIPEFNPTDMQPIYAPVGAGRLNSIVWNGTAFCAVGDDGLIVTLAADGVTEGVERTADASYTGDFHYVFADSNGRLFACGDNGEIQRSIDNGATWTRVHTDASLGILGSGVAITLASQQSLVVGTSDENKVLRSTNNGTSFTEVEIFPEVAFDGSQVLVLKLGPILCAILRNETHDSLAVAVYSFDGGATWPVYGSPITCYGIHALAATQNGERAIIVGGSPDGTTAGYVFSSWQIVRAV